jgi:hypothetical protein
MKPSSAFVEPGLSSNQTGFLLIEASLTDICLSLSCICNSIPVIGDPLAFSRQPVPLQCKAFPLVKVRVQFLHVLEDRFTLLEPQLTLV